MQVYPGQDFSTAYQTDTRLTTSSSYLFLQTRVVDDKQPYLLTGAVFFAQNTLGEPTESSTTFRTPWLPLQDTQSIQIQLLAALQSPQAAIVHFLHVVTQHAVDHAGHWSHNVWQSIGQQIIFISSRRRQAFYSPDKFYRKCSFCFTYAWLSWSWLSWRP